MKPVIRKLLETPNRVLIKNLYRYHAPSAGDKWAIKKLLFHGFVENQTVEYEGENYVLKFFHPVFGNIEPNLTLETKIGKKIIPITYNRLTINGIKFNGFGGYYV